MERDYFIENTSFVPITTSAFGLNDTHTIIPSLTKCSTVECRDTLLA